MKSLKKWFWSYKVQDHLRSMTVTAMTIGIVFFSEEPLNMLLAWYSGDYTAFTLYGFSILVLRMFMRGWVGWLLLQLKRFFPTLPLPVPNLDSLKKR